MNSDPRGAAGGGHPPHDVPDASDLPDWLDALDDLLADLDSPLLPSSFDALCATVAVSPELLTPADWLPAVWGDAAAPFDDAATLRAAVDLLTRACNDVAAGLMDGTWRPLFDLDTDDTILWQIWMDGFAAAVGLAPDAWAGLADRRDADAVTAAAVLLRLSELAGMPTRDILAEPGDAALAAEAPDLIAIAIHELHRARLAGYATPQPVRRVKVGRNDPCPCGSGRKYKRCCGA